ncbi:MAG TPA: SagB/ThcOx family dehydrogenase [Chloroflexia bacterium]|nr:SagB/ThcOx family dehydrogenase [Chloroflexia bacterium]
MFRTATPLAWLFHHNTCYGRFQTGDPPQPTAGVAPFKEYLAAPLIPLPPAGALPLPLGAAIRARCSCREFGDRALLLAALATLLQASYGIQERVLAGDYELLTRPVPSGGGLYPLEIYLLVERVTGLGPGVYHYAVLAQALEHLPVAPLPPARLVDLFLGQTYAADAALVIVLTAVPARSLAKYGDRGYRLILLEAGHVAQNLNLVATALGWGSVNLGGFLDLELGEHLGLNGEEVPLYALAVGWPR